MPFEGTVDIAIYLTIRSILLDSDRHGSIPANSGLFRRSRSRRPRAARKSGASRRRHRPLLPGNIVADTVMRALAPLVPDNVSAGVGNLKVGVLGPQRGSTGCTWTSRRAATAAGPARTGSTPSTHLYANTRNNPIEDIESHYPLR